MSVEIGAYPPTTRIFFETAKKEIVGMDRDLACRRTGAAFDTEREEYVLQYLGAEARVHAQTCAMEWGLPVESLFHITLLHYLMFADGSRPKGELITLHEAAPAGSTRVNNMLQANIPPLVETFAGDLELLFASAGKLGGRKLSENTVEIPVLPHIPVQVTVWPADDEFPADARILFDKTLRGQLCAEDIVYVPDVTVRALVWAAGKPFRWATSL